MPRIAFTPNLRAHVECAARRVAGETVRSALDVIFAGNEKLRGYILDEQGALRRHMVIYVDGRVLNDREKLSDPAGPDSEIFVMQALSGG